VVSIDTKKKNATYPRVHTSQLVVLLRKPSAPNRLELPGFLPLGSVKLGAPFGNSEGPSFIELALLKAP
jgi:hypothetical protein